MTYFSEKIYKTKNNNIKYFNDIKYNKYKSEFEYYQITDDDIKNKLSRNKKLKNMMKNKDIELDLEYRAKMKNVCPYCGCIKSTITGECLCD